MTDVENRIEYNREALKVAEASRKRMYPNLILGMELNDECLAGKGVLAVTDDVHNAIDKQRRYSPVFNEVDGKRRKIETLPNTQPVVVAKTPSLEDLL